MNTITTSAQEVIAEAFAAKAKGDSKALPVLFKTLYNESPVGKQSFQEIAKRFGEATLQTEEGFTSFAKEVRFEGIETEYDSNMGMHLETKYKFD